MFNFLGRGVFLEDVDDANVVDLAAIFFVVPTRQTAFVALVDGLKGCIFRIKLGPFSCFAIASSAAFFCVVVDANEE